MAYRVVRLVVGSAWVAIAGLLGGCVTDGGQTSAADALARADAVTVAFESVDGPPPQVFDRLVGMLDSEAKLRGIPAVTREGSATYRVRSYLSAQVRGPRTTIAWVWDVYDRDQQRALRLSGEETAAGRRGADAWAAADDVVLRRIAQAGLSGLTGVMNGVPTQTPSPPSAPPARGNGPAMADNDALPVGPPELASLGFRSR